MMGDYTSTVRTVSADRINKATPIKRELMEECEWPGKISASEIHQDNNSNLWKYSGVTSDVEDTRHTIENWKIIGYSGWPPMDTKQQVRCNVKKDTYDLLQSIIEFKNTLHDLSNLPFAEYKEIMLQVEQVRENCIEKSQMQQIGKGGKSKMYRKIIQTFDKQLQLLKEMKKLEQQISDAHIERDLLQQDIDGMQRRELQEMDQLQYRTTELMDGLYAIIQKQLKFNREVSYELSVGNPLWNTQLNASLMQAALSAMLICLLIIAMILLMITHAWPTSLQQQVKKCLNLIILSSGDVERNPGPRRMTDDDLANVDDTSLRKEDLFSVYDAVFDSRKKWFDLCLALRVSVDELAAIDLNHHGDPSACLRQGLTHWLQGHYDVKKYGPPTWRLLVDAVANSAGGDDYALAWEIKRCHEATHLIASRESQRAGNSLKKLNHSEELCSAFSTMYQRIITLLKRVDIGEVKELLHFLPNPRCLQEHCIPPTVYEDVTCTKELLRDKLYPQYINPADTFALEEIVSKFGSSTCKRLLQNYIYRFK